MCRQLSTTIEVGVFCVCLLKQFSASRVAVSVKGKLFVSKLKFLLLVGVFANNLCEKTAQNLKNRQKSCQKRHILV